MLALYIGASFLCFKLIMQKSKNKTDHKLLKQKNRTDTKLPKGGTMLEIKTTALGAELTSIKLDGKEKLHQGKTHWKRHAPILFPIVGQIKEGKAIIDDRPFIFM